MGKNFLIKVLLIFSIISCEHDSSKKENISLNQKQEKSIVVKDATSNSIDTNYKGTMFIKEQMAICILDSASSQEAPKKMQDNYNKILEDVKQINAEVVDYPGCIFYSSSPEKIVFETFMFLKTAPKKKPKHSKLVILESTQGLLYDHYGTFNNIHKSYANIEKIMKKQGYKQIGPAREIYILNEDTLKWRTRVIIPIANK